MQRMSLCWAIAMRRRLLWGLLHEDQVSGEAYEEKRPSRLQWTGTTSWNVRRSAVLSMNSRNPASMPCWQLANGSGYKVGKENIPPCYSHVWTQQTCFTGMWRPYIQNHQGYFIKKKESP
jgi:hypothetical protein